MNDQNNLKNKQNQFNNENLDLFDSIRELVEKSESDTEEEKHKKLSSLINLLSVSVSKRIERVWCAPIPPPECLERYENICKGSAKQILDQAEKQSNHRISIEKEIISDIDCRVRAQHYSLVTIIIFFIAIMFAIYLNQPWVAGVLGTSQLALIASVFYKKERDKETKIASKKQEEDLNQQDISLHSNDSSK